MSGYYQRNHLMDSGAVPEIDPDLLERCEATADRYFKRATADALQVFTTTMADIEPYRGSPRWDRLRAAAKRRYEEVSKPAAALQGRHVQELLTLGEITPELDAAWDQIGAPQPIAQAAE